MTGTLTFFVIHRLIQLYYQEIFELWQHIAAKLGTVCFHCICFLNDLPLRRICKNELDVKPV